MQAFTTSHKDPITQAAAAILFNEDVTAIEKKVKELKVGDKTNFGIVKDIGSNSISFKAKDLGVTKIAFNQRKLGSKDFVLDKLVKINESSEINEAIDFKKMGDADLKTWLKNNWTDESGISPMFGQLLKKAAGEARSRGIKWMSLDMGKKKNEDVELEEGIDFKALSAASKEHKFSDEAIDAFVKAAKTKKYTNKQINAMLYTGKLKVESLEEQTIEEAVYVPRYPLSKKAYTLVTELDDPTDFSDFMKGLASYYTDYAKQNENDEIALLAKHLTAAYKVVKDWY